MSSESKSASFPKPLDWLQASAHRRLRTAVLEQCDHTRHAFWGQIIRWHGVGNILKFAKEDERFWQKPQKWFLYGKMMTTSMFVSLLQHGWFLDEIAIASSSNCLSTTQFQIIYRTSQDIQRADGFRHDLWLSIHPYKCKDDSSPVYPDGMHI